jgi:hypothetical protein
MFIEVELRHALSFFQSASEELKFPNMQYNYVMPNYMLGLNVVGSLSDD